jgi:hypothetical protein
MPRGRALTNESQKPVESLPFVGVTLEGPRSNIPPEDRKGMAGTLVMERAPVLGKCMSIAAGLKERPAIDDVLALDGAASALPTIAARAKAGGKDFLVGARGARHS